MWLVKYVVLGLILGLAFMVLQALLEYRRRTYDPTWVLRYQQMFDEPGMKEKRRLAAGTILKNKSNLSRVSELEQELAPIDDVWVFFEDIGFYVDGDQISPKAAHHHFYHWIRGYWYASRAYLEAWQHRKVQRWNHIKGLLEELNEAEGETLSLSDEEIEVFLRQEAKA